MATDGSRRRWGPVSVFVKVLVTLVVMAALILVVVGTFIRFFYGSQLSEPVSRLVQRHVELLAGELGEPPSLARARAIGADHGFQIRYEGRDAAWATTRGLPTIDEARSSAPRLDPSTFHRYYLVSRPAGTLLFRWDFGWAAAVHDEIALSVLLLIVVFVLGAHIAIRYHLRPIRTLRNGVARLAAGDFEAQVPVAGNDELATLSRAFNAMSRRIGEMLAARDQLLRDVSHELRSPITRMKLALEFIPDDGKKRSLEADLRDMETMVVELLEIERLKDGRGGIQVERGDLVSLVRDLVCEQEAQPPGIRLTGAPSSAFVAMDGSRMRTVVKNLLDNARKYSLPDSGPVDVDIAVSGGGATLRVRDDGPGVPDGEISRVFDPFYRVDRSRARSEAGGYGLGLSMCKRIVEAHGGTISLLNNPRRGATAIVTLPLAPPGADAPSRTASLQHPSR